MNLKIDAEAIPVVVDSDGVARVGGTRVTLDTVIAAFADGATAEEIAYQYPSLQLADIYAVLTFYLRRRPDVDEYLRQRQEAAADVHKRNEAACSSNGVRDRLLVRQRARKSTAHA